jgi:hypothetical protein
MIQRIQSLYLLLAALTAALALFLPLMVLNTDAGQAFELGFRGLIDVSMETGAVLLKPVYLLSAAIVLVISESLAAIFLYRNRKLQLIQTLVLLALELMIAGLMLYQMLLAHKQYNTSLQLSPGLFIPVLLFIFTLFAWRSIKKDEDLVKSYDRLR